MKILISGKAVVKKEEKDEDEDGYTQDDYVIVTDPTELKSLDGVDDQSCFTDYMSQEEEVISGGYLEFRYDEKTNQLIAETKYDITRELTEEEIRELVDYTQGQWSDGIGEGFEQNSVYRGNDEYYISPWHSGQKAKWQYKTSRE